MSNAVDNTEACLANIERHNDATNAYITVMADQALEQAAAIDAAAARGEWGGLLAGLPISVKDCGSFEFRTAVGYGRDLPVPPRWTPGSTPRHGR